MYSPSQYATLKAAILADGTLSGYVAAANDQAIADAFNVVATPDFWVWRTRVAETEIVGSTSQDGTTWSWPALIARSQGERDCWRQMLDAGELNPSLPNLRQGIADIFSGSTNSAPAQRAHLLSVARRKATRFEKLFAAGGDGSTATPATMALEGQLSYADVSIALRYV